MDALPACRRTTVEIGADTGGNPIVIIRNPDQLGDTEGSRNA